MTVNLTLLVLMGTLFAIGIYLLLERSLTRVLLGIILISNGVNLLLLHTAGRAGLAPIYSPEISAEEYLDPLPQALLLTAIVIAFALVSFMLALIYRSWVLARQDELADDEEDRRIASYANVHDTEEDAELATETTEFADDTDSSGRQLLNPRRGTDAVEQPDADPVTAGVEGPGAVDAARSTGDRATETGGGHLDQLDVTVGAGRADGPSRQAPVDPDADPTEDSETSEDPDASRRPDSAEAPDPSEDPDPDGAPDQTEGGRRR